MKKRFSSVPVVAVGVVLACAAPSVLASHMSPGLRVDQPGMVLLVDGKDHNQSVSLTINTRSRGGGLDFGFMNGDVFSSLSGQWCGATSQVFAGGTTIDFAVRSKGADSFFGTADDQIFRLSDPAHYASQYYSGKVSPWKSANPVVDDPYHRNLTLVWDVNHDGVTELKVMLQARKHFDGLQFAATPVPVPAAVWLLGSGLLGLLGIAGCRNRLRR